MVDLTDPSFRAVQEWKDRLVSLDNARSQSATDRSSYLGVVEDDESSSDTFHSPPIHLRVSDHVSVGLRGVASYLSKIASRDGIFSVEWLLRHTMRSHHALSPSHNSSRRTYALRIRPCSKLTLKNSKRKPRNGPSSR